MNSIKRICVMACLAMLLVSPCLSCEKKANAESVPEDIPAASPEPDAVNVNHITVDVTHKRIDKNSLCVPDATGNVREIPVCVPAATDEDAAYIIGYGAARQLKELFRGIYERDPDAALTDREIGSFLQGLVDEESGVAMDDNYIMGTSAAMDSIVRDRMSERERRAKEYFAAIESRDGIGKTESGLLYEIKTSSGSSEKIPDGSTVVVDYVMSVCTPGSGVDDLTEADRGNDIEFSINSLIPGAKEGIMLMSVGDSCRLYINPELGYGQNAVSPVIQQNSYLVFDVTVKELKASEGTNAENFKANPGKPDEAI